MFDDYTIFAHSVMTTHTLYGDTTRAVELIADELREFVNQKILASSPLLPSAPRAAEERNPLPETTPGGGP